MDEYIFYSHLKLNILGCDITVSNLEKLTDWIPIFKISQTNVAYT
jgi:hypothetical protein